jgi:hypothetical protein
MAATDNNTNLSVYPNYLVIPNSMTNQGGRFPSF